MPVYVKMDLKATLPHTCCLIYMSSTMLYNTFPLDSFSFILVSSPSTKRNLFHVYKYWVFFF